MKEKIDCLLIGHNEMEFEEYEKTVARMGVNSGAYRDLNMNFIRYNNRPYSISEIYNIFSEQDEDNGESNPFTVTESFSAAVAYLGTYLDRRGYTFEYVNSFQQSRDRLAEILETTDVLTVAITTTLYVTVQPIQEIVNFIKQHNREVKIIIGGPYVSTKARTMGRDELDYQFTDTIGADYYVNSSQGEAALVKIIEAEKQNRPKENIPNIYIRTGEGIKQTPLEKEDNRLSENMVRWNLYSDRLGKFVNVRTAISCPFSCSFCGFPQHAGEHQVAAVEEILEELDELAGIEQVKSVHFVDDTFNIPVKRYKQLLREMIKRKYPFKWHSYFRCQYADEEMVELMKESGCEGVFLGIESGSRTILENMNKAVTPDKYLAGIQWLKKAGIVTFGNFIIGFPGETDETIAETKNFIENGGLDFYRVQLWYCEPITPIFKQKEKFGITGESFEWAHNTMDSKKAADHVETIFLNAKGPTWVPQYNFDFDNFWHLIHRGMTVRQVRTFLESFNRAVREKLQNPAQKEVSYEALAGIEEASRQRENETESRQSPVEQEAPIGDNLESEFDF